MSDKNLNALKTLVVSMGVLLVIGFLAVMAGAWIKLRAPAAVKNTVQAQWFPAQCPGGSVDLKGRGRVMDSTIEGLLMRVVLGKQTGRMEIVHVDICTGKELSTLHVITDGQ